MNAREAARKLQDAGFEKRDDSSSYYDVYALGALSVKLNKSSDDDPEMTRQVRTALRRASEDAMQKRAMSPIAKAVRGVVGREWTDEEDLQLMEMFSQFKSDQEIAHKLDRTPKAIELRRTRYHLKRDTGGRPIIATTPPPAPPKSADVIDIRPTPEEAKPAEDIREEPVMNPPKQKRAYHRQSKPTPSLADDSAKLEVTIRLPNGRELSGEFARSHPLVGPLVEELLWS